MFLNKSRIEEIIVGLLILGINVGVGITFLIIGYTGNIGKISLGEFFTEPMFKTGEQEKLLFTA